MTIRLEPAERAYLRKFLVDHFSPSELADAAFDLNINLAALTGGNMSDAARELVRHCEGRDQLLVDLISEILEQRQDDQLKQILNRLQSSQVPPSIGPSYIRRYSDLELLKKARDFLKANQPNEAADLLTKLHSKYPQNDDIEQSYLEAMYNVGVQAYVKEHDLFRAKQAFMSAMAANPLYKNTASLLQEVEQRLELEREQRPARRKLRPLDWRPIVPIMVALVGIALIVLGVANQSRGIALARANATSTAAANMAATAIAYSTSSAVVQANATSTAQAYATLTAMATRQHTSTPVATLPTLTPTPPVVVSAAVALRAWSGMYATVTDITTTGKLKATATQISEPQRFTWLCLANGKIALQIFDKFVSALNDEDDRNWELRAVETERLAWEEFTLLNPDTQEELPCNQALEQLKRGEVSLAFRTFHNRFVTAMGQDADWVLRAETTVLDKYEKFTAINLASTPTVIVDTMDSLANWSTFDDRPFIAATAHSVINISSVQGMVNKAIQISYDLRQGGYVGISKVITPSILAGTQSIRFHYKGTGPTNTIELKLLYKPDANGKGEVFSFAQRGIVGTNNWQTFEQLYGAFGCGDTCTTPGQQLDPARVWKIDIAVSHQQGGAPGPGSVIVDQIEAIRSSTVCPTQRDYRCLQGAMTPVATGASDMYCAETVTQPQPTLANTVYISMTKRALENFGYSLYEVEAYGPGNSQTNLLKEGTVAASSTEDDRYIVPYAIDGNLLTRWASAKCCIGGVCPKDDKGNLKCDNPDSQDPQWLKITLPKPAPIDRIVLKWERAYAVEYCVIVNP